MWVVFSFLCLVSGGVIMEKNYPDRPYQYGTAWERTLQYQTEVAEMLFQQRVKFVITWFIAWLGIIGVAYAGGIVVAWVIKGFRHNR